MENIDTPADKVNTLKVKLTLRYAIALSLIACVLVASFILTSGQIRQNEKDAYIINISGMQRMLSQRIALLALEIGHVEDDKAAEKYYLKLRTAVDTMNDNHMQLTSGSLKEYNAYELSESIRDIYFGENALDERVKMYINHAQDFIFSYEKTGAHSDMTREKIQIISSIARNGLLEDLNRAVFQYQHEAEMRVQAFRKHEVIGIFIGLLVLLIEVMLIFRPMVNSIARNVKNLREANAELLEFSYRVSHDVRAPVVSSLGLLDVTKDALSNDQKTTAINAVDHIQRSMKNLERLIDDIVLLTRVKLTDLKPEPVDPEIVIDEILEKFIALEGFEKIKIDKDVQTEDAICVKRILLQQSLENLISNSIKYADLKKESPYIKVSISKSGSDIQARVADNGIGIPEQSHDQVFNMFQRFHPKTSFGSGLGLYLVYQNAVALGGKVEFIPQQDGTEFVITFPEEECKPTK